MAENREESGRRDDALWIQPALDAGRDVDSGGQRWLCRTTIYFRKGSGCIVGNGKLYSIAHPVAHGAPDYERWDEITAELIGAEDLELFLLFPGEPIGVPNDQKTK